MADRLEIEIQIRNVAQAISGLSQVATAAGQLGGGGSFAAASGSSGMAQIASAVAATGAAANPALRAIEALVIALTALGSAAIASAEQIRSIAQMQAALNSTEAETVAMLSLSVAAGTNAASAAAALRQQANFDPFGRFAAGRLGLPFQPFDIGSAADLSDLLLTAIRRTRQQFQSDPAGAELTMRQLPALQAFAEIIKSTRDLTPLLEQQAEVQKRLASPEFIDASAEFHTMLGLVATDFRLLAADIGSKVLPALSWYLENLHKFLSGANAPVGQSLIPQGNIQRPNGAVNANTAATEANTNAINNFAGIWGGGPIARAAMPRAFGPGGMGAHGGGWEFLKGDAGRLGAYSIGL